MALYHSPRIITENLILCLDAGNPKSYPGSGTTWTDLSGRGNIGNVFTSAPGTGNILLNTFKAAISYNSTIGRLQVGTASTEVTPSQLPVNPNTFGIGSLGGGATPLNGIIKQIVYYPIKLNNNILETFTK